MRIISFKKDPRFFKGIIYTTIDCIAYFHNGIFNNIVKLTSGVEINTIETRLSIRNRICRKLNVAIETEDKLFLTLMLHNGSHRDDNLIDVFPSRISAYQKCKELNCTQIFFDNNGFSIFVKDAPDTIGALLTIMRGEAYAITY